MTADADVEVFRKCWIDEFKTQQSFLRRRPSHGWQGGAAHEELQRADKLFLVLPHSDGDYPFSYLTFRLAREIRAYKRCAINISPNNQCFNDGLVALSGSARDLRKTHAQAAQAKPAVDEVLSRAAFMLDVQRAGLERQRDTFWDDLLLASGEERKDWPLDFDNREWVSYGKQRVHLRPPADFRSWAERFNKFKYPERLLRRIDLDSRVQVRIAVVLRFYLDLEDTGVSRRTIARLVALAYICGGLAEVKAHKCVIKGTGHSLKVKDVEQTLRRAGVK
jgi:hypothetical protein